MLWLERVSPSADLKRMGEIGVPARKLPALEGRVLLSTAFLMLGT